MLVMLWNKCSDVKLPAIIGNYDGLTGGRTDRPTRTDGGHRTVSLPITLSKHSQILPAVDISSLVYVTVGPTELAFPVHQVHQYLSFVSEQHTEFSLIVGAVC